MLHKRWRLAFFARPIQLVGLLALVVGAAGWSAEAPALAARSPQARMAHTVPSSTPVASQTASVFVASQVIVTGPASQVNQLVDQVAPGVQLELLRNLDLSYTQR